MFEFESHKRTTVTEEVSVKSLRFVLPPTLQARIDAHLERNLRVLPRILIEDIPRALHIVPEPAKAEPEMPLLREDPDLPEDTHALFFVLRRGNGEWDLGTQIAEVIHDCREAAEECARAWKRKYPAQHFGVATLVSEVRLAVDPIETIKLQ